MAGEGKEEQGPNFGLSENCRNFFFKNIKMQNLGPSFRGKFLGKIEMLCSLPMISSVGNFLTVYRKL